MRTRPDIALVPVDRDLDVTSVDALRQTLESLIADGCRRIILNMAGATYIDSAGMALLLAEIRRMRALKGLLSLTNVSDQVLAILRRARVVDFAPVSRTRPCDGRTVPDPSTPPLWRTVVPVNKGDLSLTRASIGHLLEQLSLTPDELFDATLAAGEAVGNAVDHTDGTGASVTIVGYRDRAVIEVTDCGPGFDPSCTSCVADPCAERGRGIRLMRLLADSVTITPRSTGEGMLVRIVKLAHATDG